MTDTPDPRRVLSEVEGNKVKVAGE